MLWIVLLISEQDTTDMYSNVVLRIGEVIKYKYDLYVNEFSKRFEVIASEEPDRESFIKAL
ncbi:unnamed protein product [Clonostachys byssicola]|uniref:Uncharacterized protein n=1 Tax=Clonostachys byssicola TaxID=160290 RepID=A0A9N9UHW1_9HYPO|nr:unnamed protein product [Clonostachys byssicola]